MVSSSPAATAPSDSRSSMTRRGSRCPPALAPAAGAREAVVPVDSEDLFDEVVLDRHVRPPGRDRHGEALAAPACPRTNPSRARASAAKSRSRSSVPASSRRRERRSAARRAFQAAPRASTKPGASVPPADSRRIAAARSSASGIASGSAPRSKRCDASVWRPRRRDVFRMEGGSHHAASRQDVLRRGGHGGVEPAHDARERDRPLGVRDDDVGRIESPLDAVERHELLAATRLAHDDAPAREPVEVEGMERLADLPHHVVRRVHGGADGLAADRGEAGADPFGRRRAAGDAGDDAGAEATAEARDFDGDGGEVRGGGRRPHPFPLPGGEGEEASPAIAAISRARPRWLMTSGRFGVISTSKTVAAPSPSTDSTGTPPGRAARGLRRDRPRR